MGHKDLLVVLGPAEEGDARLALAISPAQTHHARLVGVDGRSLSGSHADPLTEVADVENRFQRKLAQSGLDGVFRRVNPGSPDATTLFAHYADLVIAPLAHEDILPQIPEQTLLISGIPVLVLPLLWQPAPLGESVLIAWNGSREATRAIHDAMPLLVRAPKTTLFVFGASEDATRANADLVAEHLRNHGVSPEILTWPEGEGMSPVTALIASHRSAGSGSDRGRRPRALSPHREPVRQRDRGAAAPALNPGFHVPLNAAAEFVGIATARTRA